MVEERESLPEIEQLKAQAESFSSAASFWLETTGSLGTEQGPAWLNYREVSGTERIGRIRIAARLREKVTTEVIPYYREKAREISEQIERRSAVVRVREDLLEIRRLAEVGYATPEMVEDAEKEYERLTVAYFTGTLAQEVTPQAPVEPEQPPVVPVEPPAGPVETPPGAEEEKLPLILVNLARKEINVENGKLKRIFRTGLKWEILLYLLKHPTQYIETDILLTEMHRINSKTGYNSVGSLMSFIRQNIEPDPKNPIIISRSGWEERTAYRINAEVRFVEETLTEKSEEEKKAQALSDIAEIQRLINSGILTSPEQIAKAQEMARQVGGTIDLQTLSVPRFKKLSAEELAELDIKEKAEKEKKALPVKENSLIVLSTILDNPSDLTVREVLDAMGTMKNGRKYTWVQAVSSMFLAAKLLASRVKNDDANEEEIELWEKIKFFVDKVEERNSFVIRNALQEKLKTWFKEKSEKLSNQPNQSVESLLEQDEDVQISGNVEEGKPIEPEPELELLPVKKLTEKQKNRQELFMTRVREILSQFGRIENFPQDLSASRITNIAKHELGETIADTFMEQAVERGYVQPIQAEGHHVKFSQKDFIVLVYIKRFGNNISPTQKRDLFRIIEREYGSWGEERNGK